MSFRLLLHSPIPVVRGGNGFTTLDLWAVDLDGQRRVVDALTLLCPVHDGVPADWQGTAPVPAGIEVVDADTLDAGLRAELLGRCDVVQTFGGQGWRASAPCRRLVRDARRRGVRSIVGLSSNRARTVLMNARLGSVREAVAGLRAGVAYVGLRATYAWLGSRTDGTFIVGEGLRPLVAAKCPSLHVGIASWTRAADVAGLRDRNGSTPAEATGARLRQLCIASRLERMKGVHVGIEALARLHASGRDGGVGLTIFGAGAERERLEAQAAAAGIASQVRFGGVLAYPSPFLDRLGAHGIVVLPNLNDEQPRLVFDAIGRGCLPVCPDTPAYRALGLPAVLRYAVGDSRSLAEALAVLLGDAGVAERARSDLLALAERHTLESMHALRADWIRTEVLGRARADEGDAPT